MDRYIPSLQSLLKISGRVLYCQRYYCHDINKPQWYYNANISKYHLRFRTHFQTRQRGMLVIHPSNLSLELLVAPYLAEKRSLSHSYAANLEHETCMINVDLFRIRKKTPAAVSGFVCSVVMAFASKDSCLAKVMLTNK